MKLRQRSRNALLLAGFMHPAALGVLARRGPTAMRQYLSEMYRCSKSDAGLHLTTVSSDELAERGNSFQVVRPLDVGGSMTLTEISAVCQLVAAWQPTKILEIGTFKGLTTLNLALNAPDAVVHTIDLPEGFEADATVFANNDAAIIDARGFYHYRGSNVEDRVVQHYGDTATFDFMGAIGPSVDVCLIDAAHSYQYVRNDTAKALAVMDDAGWLLWHDYGYNDFLTNEDNAWGVSRFLHELRDLGARVVRGTSIGALHLSPSIKGDLVKLLAATQPST